MSETKKKSPGPKAIGESGKQNTQEILAQFSRLREEQRQLVGKVAEIESEEHEYGVVISTLGGVDADRKCFRLVGGVLVERTVGDVLPDLNTQRDQMKVLVETLNKNIESKGREINVYREKHGIRVQGEPEPDRSSRERNEEERKKNEGPSGVLVAPASSSS